jgi:GAF domain-containing protein
MMTIQQRLSNIFQSLFNTRAYNDSLSRERANLVYGILTLEFVLLFTSMALPVWFINSDARQTFFQAALETPVLFMFPLGLLVLVVAGFFLTRYRAIQISAWIPIIINIATIEIARNLSPVDTLAITAMVVLSGLIVMSGLLQGYPGLWVSTLASLAVMLLFNLTPNERWSVVLFIAIMTGLLTLYLRFAAVNRNVGVAESNIERIKFAEFISEISTRASQRMPLRDLLAFTVNLILEKYPQFYHSQVFLLDERGVQARLVASTGEAGKQLLEKNHSLNVGSVSVIGEVTGDGKPKIEVAGKGVHRFNAILSATKLEAAFPLRIGTQVIGALDLQSRYEYPFGQHDIATFQSLADSLSLVIDNVRQYESAVERVQENQALTEQARSALREVDRLNKRLIGRAWTEFLRTQASGTGIDLDAQTQVITPREEWTDTLRQAAVQNKTVQQQNIVAVPLRLRGQVIGAMEFELDEKGEFSQEDLELIEEIGERFGLAAENTRLVEESQRVAQREALINEISSRMQASNNVEATLTEAARSLRETLQAHRVMIRLGSPINAAPKGAPTNASR